MSTRHFAKTTRGPGTRDFTTIARYRVTDNTGRHLGYVTASQTSLTYKTWTAWGRFGTSPVASGFQTRSAAAEALR